MTCENLLTKLKPEIQVKCEEIKIRKKAKKLKAIFILSTILLPVLPLLMIILGFSFLYSFTIIMALGIILLFVAMPSMISVYRSGDDYACQ